MMDRVMTAHIRIAVRRLIDADPQAYRAAKDDVHRYALAVLAAAIDTVLSPLYPTLIPAIAASREDDPIRQIMVVASDLVTLAQSHDVTTDELVREIRAEVLR